METTESTDVVKLLEEVDFEKAAVHMKARAIFMPNLLKQMLVFYRDWVICIFKLSQYV